MTRWKKVQRIEIIALVAPLVALCCVAVSLSGSRSLLGLVINIGCSVLNGYLFGKAVSRIRKRLREHRWVTVGRPPEEYWYRCEFCGAESNAGPWVADMPCPSPFPKGAGKSVKDWSPRAPAGWKASCR